MNQATSQFYENQEQILPISTSLAKAMCVLVGVASLNEMFMSGFSPLASSVQTPFGPLKRFTKKKTQAT